MHLRQRRAHMHDALVRRPFRCVHPIERRVRRDGSMLLGSMRYRGCKGRWSLPVEIRQVAVRCELATLVWDHVDEGTAALWGCNAVCSSVQQLVCVRHGCRAGGRNSSRCRCRGGAGERRRGWLCIVHPIAGSVHRHGPLLPGRMRSPCGRYDGHVSLGVHPTARPRT